MNRLGLLADLVAHRLQPLQTQVYQWVLFFYFAQTNGCFTWRERMAIASPTNVLLLYMSIWADLLDNP
jgi:hypothetical protein